MGLMERHTLRRFAGEDVSWIRRACQATTVLYLLSTGWLERVSASCAAMCEQPAVSPASTAAKVTSVAETDSSPNKVGWVVSDEVDMAALSVVAVEDDVAFLVSARRRATCLRLCSLGSSSTPRSALLQPTDKSKAPSH